MPPRSRETRPATGLSYAAILFLLALTLPARSHATSARPDEPQDTLPDQTPQRMVVDLTPAPGTTQRILVLAPPHPRATLILLPGGTGDIGIARNGTLHHTQNFLLRMRAEWVAHGYAVIIPDALTHNSPQAHTSLQTHTSLRAHTTLRDTRSSPTYGELVVSLARYARTQHAIPVFLVGTSQGTIAATNGAARAAAGLIAGLVLTETVALPGHLSTETVFDAHPQNVRVPVLIIANQEDACPVASPRMATQIAQAMTHAPEVRLLSVSGGPEHAAKPCRSRSAHGYEGMETSVSRMILSWLQAHGA
ncbi:alpha/beta fold hydrolase [Acetobacter persici]|uniref:alpha/beta hydrolase n=1 Tax=Acetobacter persici TaxID=1076596 RepID=UPI002012C7F7|nr:alpha/beta hydrolase [Acetobacter persici]